LFPLPQTTKIRQIKVKPAFDAFSARGDAGVVCAETTSSITIHPVGPWYDMSLAVPEQTTTPAAVDDTTTAEPDDGIYYKHYSHH